MDETITVELEKSEVRKLQAAVGEMIDTHHTAGNDPVANEYRSLQSKLSEAKDE